MKKRFRVGCVPLLSLLLITSIVGQAEARCARIPEAGYWVNVQPGSQGIAGLRIEYVCKDVIFKDEFATKGPNWYVEAIVSCGNLNCGWGRVGAGRLANHYRESRRGNNQTTAPPIFASYDLGFARKYLYISLLEESHGPLSVVVYTDYLYPFHPDKEEQFQLERPKERTRGPSFMID